jgi:nucleoside transporter
MQASSSIPGLKARLSVLQFMQYFLWGTWFVTLGTYLMQTMQLSGIEVGAAYGATAIAASVTPFLLGMAADRFFSIQKLLAVLHLCGAGFLWAASHAQHFSLFYAFFLPYTLLYIPTFSLTAALCFRHLPDPGRDFPKVRVWGTISWMVAGVMVSLLAIEDSALPMRISAGVSILQGLYCLTLPKTPPLGRQTKVSLRQWFGPEVKALFRNRSFTVLVICLALSCIPGAFYYSFVNPYLNESGIAQAAGKMSLGQASELALVLLLPWLSLRVSLKRILFIGFAAWGLRYALLINGSEWMMYVAILLHGVCYSFTALAAQIYVDSITPPSLKSTVQGFITFLTMGIGILIGSWIAGAVVAMHTLPDGARNWPAIWLIPAALGLSVAVVFLLFFKEREEAR